jgi:beta-lactamase regulating signal transducer with metallopeptidase domain
MLLSRSFMRTAYATTSACVCVCVCVCVCECVYVYCVRYPIYGIWYMVYCICIIILWKLRRNLDHLEVQKINHNAPYNYIVLLN